MLQMLKTGILNSTKMSARCAVFLLFFVGVHCMDEDLRAQSVLYGITTSVENAENSSLCHKDLHTLYESIEKQLTWAIKVVDASGSPSPGFLLGNNFWLGSHSLCFELQNRKPFELNMAKIPHPPPTPFDYPPYDLSFVVFYIKHNNTLQQHTQLPFENIIKLGLCAPKTCKANDMQQLLEAYLDGKYLKMQEFYSLDLEIKGIRILNGEILWFFQIPKTILALSLGALILILVISGTAYNIKYPLHKDSENDACNNSNTIPTSTIGEISRCFALNSNIATIMNTKISSESIGAVHGLRFFGMLYVTSVHSIYFLSDYLQNTPMGFRIAEPFMGQIFSNCTYQVDGFYFLSGFLLSYLFYKSKKHLLETKSDKPINYREKFAEFFSMFANRFIRLTPAYAILLLLTDVAFTFLHGMFPVNFNEEPDINCDKYWWRNLLYISNLYPRSEMCMSWSYYVANDMQFFVVSIILLLLSTVAFKLAAALIFAMIFCSIGINAYMVNTIGYIPTMDEQYVTLDIIYDLPWNRIGPYFVGIITGYILVVKLDKKLVLKRKTLAVLWTLFPALNLWILFGLYGRQMSLEFSTFYMSVSRTLWGVGIAWLLIACCTNNAGVLNRFLSYKGWLPFSRLTYCAYLVNPLVVTSMYECSGTTFNMSFGTSVITVTFSILLTYATAFWCTLFFESPFVLLIKKFITGAKVTPKSDEAVNPA